MSSDMAITADAMAGVDSIRLRAEAIGDETGGEPSSTMIDLLIEAYRLLTDWLFSGQTGSSRVSYRGR